MKSHIVGEVMTSEVVRARRDTSFKEVVRLLDRYRIGGLPVVDRHDRVLGVVCGTDLLRGRAAHAEQGHGHRFRVPGLGRPAARGTVAEEMMSRPALTVRPEQPVPEAARLMERHHVELLPVVDQEGRLVGIVTHRDLLRVFLRADEEIRRQVIDETLAVRPGLPPHAVIVSVRDGMVTLEGRLEHRSDIPPVVRAAWRVEGVIGVDDSLTFRVDDRHPPAKHPSRRISHYWLPER